MKVCDAADTDYAHVVGDGVDVLSICEEEMEDYPASLRIENMRFGFDAPIDIVGNTTFYAITDDVQKFFMWEHLFHTKNFFRHMANTACTSITVTLRYESVGSEWRFLK